MKKTVTATQLRALEKLCSRSGAGSYALGETLGTLNSLALKGYVKADRSRPGGFYSPRTAITWEITDAGRAIVRSAWAGRTDGQSGKVAE